MFPVEYADLVNNTSYKATSAKDDSQKSSLRTRKSIFIT